MTREFENACQVLYNEPGMSYYLFFTGLAFGLFWNSFLEIKWFGHLDFSWLFFNLEDNSIFLSLFWLNFNKTYNTLWYFKFFLIYFGKFSLKIWPLFGLLHHMRIWPFLKLFTAKFGLFYFFGTWQPWFFSYSEFGKVECDNFGPHRKYSINRMITLTENFLLSTS